MALLVFFAFLSGIVTILSPCILPVLPVVLSGSVGGKSKPFGVVIGFIASFSFFTLALSSLVQTLAIPANTLRIAAVIIITGFGVTLALPRLKMRLESMLSGLVRTRSPSQRNGFTGGLVTGVSLGLIWTPCVGAIMASVITLAVSQQVNGGAVLIIAAYSLGTAIPMFALMVGGRKLLNRFPRLSNQTARIQRIFGIVMIIAALMIGVGADRKFQAYILRLFPEYGTGLTTFENTETVRKALDDWRGNASDEESFVWNDPPQNARIGDFGAAPPLIAEGPWFNTQEPLDMERLRGKVVLIDFWTYSCVNCVRTIGHLQGWYDAYSEYGFEIIGVHSPEFPFERNVNNVRKAVKDLGVTWPVVMDNDFSQWNSYNNRFWPAHFFIDHTGNIRYFQFGEGAYDEAEKVIRKLLSQAGQQPGGYAETAQSYEISSRTPETYLGYRRSESMIADALIQDRPAAYSLADDPASGQWSLEGEWIIRNDFIELDGTGSLELAFEAKDIFLVIEPLDENSELRILIDAFPGGDTEDVRQGVLRPDESRLYHLSSFDEPSEHLLRLIIEGHVRLYSFTFG
jgi:cytochrome c biogenesis protein CcdA/thiol-disulfide isomerase/thioredoxin